MQLTVPFLFLLPDRVSQPQVILLVQIKICFSRNSLCYQAAAGGFAVPELSCTASLCATYTLKASDSPLGKRHAKLTASLHVLLQTNGKENSCPTSFLFYALFVNA